MAPPLAVHDTRAFVDVKPEKVSASVGISVPDTYCLQDNLNMLLILTVLKGDFNGGTPIPIKDCQHDTRDGNATAPRTKRNVAPNHAPVRECCERKGIRSQALTVLRRNYNRGYYTPY